MSEQERPYPEGIAWDEAWRQRQLADELTDALRELYESAQLNSVHYSKSSSAFKQAGELLRRIGK